MLGDNLTKHCRKHTNVVSHFISMSSHVYFRLITHIECNKKEEKRCTKGRVRLVLIGPKDAAVKLCLADSKNLQNLQSEMLLMMGLIAQTVRLNEMKSSFNVDGKLFKHGKSGWKRYEDQNKQFVI